MNSSEVGLSVSMQLWTVSFVRFMTNVALIWAAQFFSSAYETAAIESATTASNTASSHIPGLPVLEFSNHLLDLIGL
jgi:hypothetical protein